MNKKLLAIITLILVILLTFTATNISGFAARKPADGPRPLILLNGYKPSSSDTLWDDHRAMMELENHYVDKGIINYEIINKESERWPTATAVSALYYKEGPTEGIDQYAQRLKQIVEKVKINTDSEQVDILAYSMGGLVARAYIEKYDGAASVNKLIMAGTPNRGISDFVSMGCSDSKLECNDMKESSDFLVSLNPNQTTKYITLAGNLYGLGTDGIVKTSSVNLPTAKNIILKNYMHRDLYDPPTAPDLRAYSIIMAELIPSRIPLPR